MKLSAVDTAVLVTLCAVAVAVLAPLGVALWVERIGHRRKMKHRPPHRFTDREVAELSRRIDEHRLADPASKVRSLRVYEGGDDAS